MQNSYVHRLSVLIISFFLATLSSLHADFDSSIDDAYDTVSTGVLDLSEYLDKSISKWMNGYNDVHCEPGPLQTTENNNIDAFFQDNKYLNDTEDTYIRLRLKGYLYSREDTQIKAKVSARIPFNRCKKEWQLFLQDVQGNKGEIQNTDPSSGGIGIRFFRDGLFGIKSSYSLGIRDTTPYVRARYRYPFEYESWIIEPVQSFKYSEKYHLESETNIYFDKKIDEDQLFRIQLNRESSDEIRGIDYGLSFEYFSISKKNTGYSVRQSFYGNTYYNDFYSFDPHYTGINNYVTSFSWRENIWRKWFYYEVRPTVNFHKDYDYSPSYSFRIMFDFYFGKFN